VNQTNTTPELILKFRENNMYTIDKMKPCSEFENEFKKIQNKHNYEDKDLESKYDSELKELNQRYEELKQRYDDEREKLKNNQYQEIEKLFSDLLRRQNRKQGAKRLASRPSTYPTFSGSSHPTIKQPSQHPSYNTCPSTPSGLSRELSDQYLSFHSPSEANFNLEEWPDGSYDCTVDDSSVFNEMSYSNDSPFSYFIPSNTYGNPTLISKDGQENIRCQYSNIEMSDANDGSYSDRIG
ncbi:22004_t:CDS:2, partial [Gigaspora rosea]